MKEKAALLLAAGGGCATMVVAPQATPFTAYQRRLLVFLSVATFFEGYSLSMVYAAEDFPADRRGHAIGVIQAASALGGIICAETARCS